MSIKRIATLVSGGTAVAAVIAALTSAPANAQDIWVALTVTPDYTAGYMGEGPTSEAAAGAALNACHPQHCIVVAQMVNMCAAAAVTDTQPVQMAVGGGATWVEAEDMALASAGTGPRHTLIVRCAGGGARFEPPAQAPAPAPQPQPAPAPQPQPAPAPAPGPCIPDPFNLNFPGAC
jgi:hypothetical protein